MTNENSLAWLYAADEPDYETTTHISEGGAYTNDQIGLWEFGTLWFFKTPLDVNLKELGRTFDGFSEKPYGNLWYWKQANYDNAVKIGKDIAMKFGPQHVWHFTMQTENFLNFNGRDKTAFEVFGKEVDFDVQLSSIANKGRANFQLMMLPSIVQELAMSTGALKERVYEYKKLPNNVEDLMNDADGKLARQIKYVGTEENWLDSELGQARANLWALLGEKNPEAYLIKAQSEKSKKYVIASEQLKRLAWIVYNPNTISTYANMVRIIQLNASEFSKNTNKQLTTYVCAGIFKSKAEAMASFASEAEAVDDGMPALPKAWSTSTKAEFIEFVNDKIAELKLTKKPVAVVTKWFKDNASSWQETSAATYEETLPWLPYLNIG